MRQRITFLQRPEDSIDPKTLKVTKNAISTTALKAAREDRVTFGLDELPQELYRVLKACHELHIRWASQIPYESIPPLVSRVSPGLHVFYTPQRNSNNSNLLCPILKKIFSFGDEMECVSPEESFTSLPTERFSHSAASQHYSPLPTPGELVLYILAKLCDTNKKDGDVDCLIRTNALTRASSIDIDFDTISHALTITAFWPYQTWAAPSTPLNLKNTNHDRLEVGILSVEKPQEPEELSLGGFLTVVGEDDHPSPTLFSFPARHHPVSQTFSSTFLLPSGLHPTLQLSMSGSEPPLEERSCSLHAHLTLPKQIFADKYQLSDPLFLASKNLSAIHYISPSVDLEAPAYTLPLWGSSLLLELSPPSSPNSKWTAEIPLHLRYLLPNLNGTEEISIPYPVLFWACTAEEGSKFTVDPFERVNLGYEGLFGPRTMFYHLSPEASASAVGVENRGKLVNGLTVPVLDLGKSQYVEVGTAIVVGVGFAWVVWCLIRVWGRSGYGRVKGVEGEKKRQ